MSRYALAATLVLATPALHAGVLYQSAELVSAGVTLQEVDEQTVPAIRISDNQYAGARFYLSDHAHITGLGGHFISRNDSSNLSTIFGAVVALNSEYDLPDSFSLDTDDVLGVALIDTEVTSSDTSGVTSIFVTPGWYAVIYGAGRFGAVGSAAAPMNNSRTGTYRYISYGPSVGWRDIPSFFDNIRYVVRGHLIPEPASGCIAMMLVAHATATRRRVGARTYL